MPLHTNIEKLIDVAANTVLMVITAIVAIRANRAITCITAIITIKAIIAILVITTIVCYIEEATTKVITAGLNKQLGSPIINIYTPI